MINILQRNNVKVLGEGEKTILFAHGLNCDQNSYKYITGAFENKYKLVLFDFVGAGNSDISAYDTKRYSTLYGYAEDILEICNVLELKEIIFIGHSVSCMIGILASIAQPGLFTKLVFIGPSPRYINDKDYQGGFEQEDIDGLFEIMDENYIDWTRNMAPRIMGNPEQADVNQHFSDTLCSTDPTIGKAFAHVTFLADNRGDLPYVPVESLTLQCSEDILAPIEVGYYIKEHTPGNQLIILDATGHCPHLTAPEATIEAIQKFIE